MKDGEAGTLSQLSNFARIRQISSAMVRETGLVVAFANK